MCSPAPPLTMWCRRTSGSPLSAPQWRPATLRQSWHLVSWPVPSFMQFLSDSAAHDAFQSGHGGASVESLTCVVEFSVGLALLGPIDEKFVDVVDVYDPLESGQRDKCFISKG